MLQKLKLPFCILSILWIIITPIYATHINGGYFSYTCQGNNIFEFTLNVIRDCSCAGCAALDEVASIGVYECEGVNACGELTQEQAFLNLSVPLFSTTPLNGIQPETDLCAELGTYVFTVNLPASSNKYYYLAYQRCCRSAQISNLQETSTTGMTISALLTPEAIRTCNSSPLPLSLNNSIAVNTPFDLQFGFSDADGDSLVYELCSPLSGGGPITAAVGFSSCEGSSPRPACPPPYSSIRYIPELYSALNPLPFDTLTPIMLDAQTGTLSGVATRLGIYQLGICVTEYRDTVKLSETLLDLPINVLTAVPVSNEAFKKIIPVHTFPNPTKGEIIVELPEIYADLAVQIYASNGQIQPFTFVRKNDKTLTLKILNPGFHYLIIKSGNAVYSSKVVCH